METQVQNNVKNKQTKTRKEKNVHERRSKKKKRYKTIVEIQSNIRETRPPSWTAILYNYPTRGRWIPWGE